MTRTQVLVLFWLLLAWPAASLASARSRQEEDLEVLELRVLSLDAEGRVTIDRGEVDGLALDDVVLLFPRDGGARRGSIVALEGRSAVVELADGVAGVRPGVRGEVRVPRARLVPADEAPPPDDPAAADEGGGAGEDAGAPERLPWADRDDAWRPGMPLLSRVRAVRPAERATRVSGRGYLDLDHTWTTEDEREDRQWRLGTDVRVENPFRRGGALRFDAEYDKRATTVPDDDDEDETYLRVERLSYAWGGDRFTPDRFEVGRFLQRTMPEFGVVDGVQWERRRPNGDRYGASVGYLPELDAEFDTGDDLAVAAWYLWTVDDDERMTVTGGVQKTWHDGEADRDLLVARVRYLPADGWDVLGTTWVDLYGGDDDAKGSGPEVTHAILTLARAFERRGALDVTYRRLRFPELLRDELLPVDADQLADDRYDRLSVGGWTPMRGDRRLHGELGVWDDEDEAGGDVEVGVEFPDLLVDGSRTDVTVFATRGRFSLGGGARLDWGLGDADGRWDLLYELRGARQDDFSSAIDDFVHHRLRGSRSVFSLGGWSVFFDLEALVYDDEGAVSVGLHLEESF